MRTVLAMILLVGLAGPGAAAVIDTFAGTGEPGYAGDGGQAVAARLHQPFHCALDGDGHLYLADNFNHCIRRIDLKTGVITTVAGTGGKKGYTGDGGPATKATFNEPYAIAIGPPGDLYIVDRLNAAVRHIKADSGVITTLAGTGKPGRSGDGGKANEAALVEPNDCCLDGKGGLLIADVGDGRIRRVDLRTGKIATFAGTGPLKGRRGRDKGDGGPADKAVIVGARAVCVDGKGNTYICEREGNAVRKVDAKGIITTLAGTGARGAADGPADKATFNGPKAIRCDAAGNIYIADTENNSIRRIDIKTLRVTTVAGGREGSGGDGGDPRKAELNRPHGCILDGDGILYIADSSNHRVRRVKP